MPIQFTPTDQMTANRLNYRPNPEAEARRSAQQIGSGVQETLGASSSRRDEQNGYYVHTPNGDQQRDRGSLTGRLGELGDRLTGRYAGEVEYLGDAAVDATDGSSTPDTPTGTDLNLGPSGRIVDTEG